MSIDLWTAPLFRKIGRSATGLSVTARRSFAVMTQVCSSRVRAASRIFATDSGTFERQRRWPAGHEQVGEKDGQPVLSRQRRSVSGHLTATSGEGSNRNLSRAFLQKKSRSVCLTGRALVSRRVSCFPRDGSILEQSNSREDQTFRGILPTARACAAMFAINGARWFRLLQAQLAASVGLALQLLSLCHPLIEKWKACLLGFDLHRHRRPLQTDRRAQGRCSGLDKLS